MTSKQVFEATLIELDKLSAPAVTLESFNYFFNKAINQFTNKQYNVGIDTDLLRTDDIRVLKATTILKPFKTPSELKEEFINKLVGNTDEISTTSDIFAPYGATYEFILPADYLHLLNCICLFRVQKRINCPYNVGDIIKKGATKCNADTWPLIIDNLYMRPSYRRPYYYINNINTQLLNPTNPIIDIPDNKKEDYSILYTGTDVKTTLGVESKLALDTSPAISESVSNTSTTGSSATDITTTLNTIKDILNGAYTMSDVTPSTNRKIRINIDGERSDDSTVVKTAGHRYGSPSNVRLEVRYGLDDSVFKLVGIIIDYIKAPQFIRLTQELLDRTEDTSLILEFPDYICQEIINELVKIILENASDPRILTLPAVSMSIAAPAQALTSQTSKK